MSHDAVLRHQRSNPAFESRAFKGVYPARRFGKDVLDGEASQRMLDARRLERHQPKGLRAAGQCRFTEGLRQRVVHHEEGENFHNYQKPRKNRWRPRLECNAHRPQHNWRNIAGIPHSQARHIMTSADTRTALQLRSLVKDSGDLELSLTRVPTPVPAANEVLVRIEAAPINPSDLGLLLAGADMSKASRQGTKDQSLVTARIPDAALKGMTARFGQSMPVGNEGAGTVVEAGSSAAAKPCSARPSPHWAAPCTRNTAASRTSNACRCRQAP